jgi:poly(3-hydroxybutyrate) depolymerase
MKKNWLPTLALVLIIVSPLIARGQFVNIIDSPFLYRPSENYNDCDESQTPPACFIDAAAPDFTKQHRGVPIRIRIPRGVSGRLPLILWSHGGGLQDNGRTLNAAWGRTLARAGYIVIHMSHLDNTRIERAAVCLEFAAANQDECNSLPMATVYQPRDANVVLSALNWLEQTIPELSGRIDYTRIAAAGWSGGSMTAMALAGARFRLTNVSNDVAFANPLPKIFLANSPQGPDYIGFKQDSWREISRPVLVATGAGDATPGEDAASRLVAFQKMPPGGKYQLYIDHPATDHTTFNLENDDYPQFAQWLASYTLAYFDSHLKHKPLAGTFLISNRLPMFGSRKRVVIARK